MALHIKDPETAQSVRRLASHRGLSLTQAVRAACEEAYRRDKRAIPLAERLEPLLANIDKLPRHGPPLTKAFFDAEWDDRS